MDKTRQRPLTFECPDLEGPILLVNPRNNKAHV